MGRLPKGAKPVYLHREAVVKRARLRRLTLGEVAARCGKSSRYLSELLEGCYQVSAIIEDRLIAALSIGPEEWDDFFWEPGSQKGESSAEREPADKKNPDSGSS